MKKQKLIKEVDKALITLKLGKNATLKDVKKAYKELAWKYHPDRCRGKKKVLCKERFIKISIARKILEDYFAGNYKPKSKKEEKERMKRYKEHIKHVKRFYDGWLGDLDF